MATTGLPSDPHPPVPPDPARPVPSGPARPDPAPEPRPPVTPVPAARVSRAGRDLRAAVAVALVLGSGVLVALFTVRHVFIGIVALAVAVSTWELAGALRRGAGIRVALAPVLVGGQAVLWLAWPFGRDGVLTAFVVTAVVCLFWRFRRGAAGYVRDVSASLLALAYVPVFASFAALLTVPADGRGRVLCFLLAVVASDTGGYVAGVLWGRHPMAPSISPKKSWEGSAGSALFGMAVSAPALVYLLDGAVWQGLVFGAAVAATATAGDLVESLIKRDLGIKDMGTLLPGHGGIMDRMDSLLPSAVVSWLLLSLLVPVG